MPTRRDLLAAGFGLPFCNILCDTASAATTLRVVLLGQALLKSNLDARQWPHANRFAALFQGADACFTDLETAIKGPHAEAPVRNDDFLHAADAGVIDCLKQVGVNLLATSNNHAYDLGAGGIRDAIEALDARGLPHAGTGLDLKGASGAGYRVTPRGTVALVAMAMGAIHPDGAATETRPGVNEIRRDPAGILNRTDVARYLAAIAAASAKADITIAYHHNHYWEKNMADTPPWQRDLAHQAVDAGAGVFVSHGPPLLHGIEIYRGKPIFYGLGGFFFQTITKPGHYPPEVWQSAVADCRGGKNGFEQIVLHPVQLNDTGLEGPTDMVTRGTPSLATGENGEKILARLVAISAPYGTRFKIADGKAIITL